MNYCSLDDAYPGLNPGCEDSYSSKEARREERRKARRCKGPAVTFQESQPQQYPPEDRDPDRQHLERPKEIAPMSSAQTGLRAHVPSDAPLGMEPFQDAGSGCGIEKRLSRERLQEMLPRQNTVAAMEATQSTLPSPAMLAQALPANQAAGFFGADPLDDGFANYAPDAKNYLMEPNFTSAFTSLNPGTGSSVASLPVPSVRDIWKPLTPSGADTSFFKQLPPPGGEYVTTNGRETQDTDYRSMAKKIDTILSRLDDIQRGPSAEQSQKEILLFVSSGVFVLFLMDLLVRKGTSLRFLKGL
jgi:hypothetical protein